MSTIKKKVFKNYPYILKSKKKGYFDLSQSVMPSDEQPVFEMRKYTPGLHSIIDSYESPSVVNLGNSVLPDYTYFDEASRVLCEYGKSYKNIMSQHRTVDGLVGDVKFEQSGVLTDFSPTNYLEINKPVTVSTGTFIFKIFFTSNTNTATILKNLDATPEKYMGASGSSPYYYGMYNSGWTLSSNTQEQDVWKFMRLEIRDGTSTMYTLDAGEYTLDTLPELSEWRTECQISGNLYSSENGFQIGANKNWSDGYFRGHIDLSQSKIIINDELYWSYEPTTYITNKDYNGCLLNYTDTGVATSLDMYSATKPGYQDFILTKDTNPNLEGYKLQYLQTISIPQHDVYTYSEQVTREGGLNKEFLLSGKTSINNYIVSNFGDSADFVSLECPLPAEANTWEIVTKVTSDQYNTDATRFFSTDVGLVSDKSAMTVGTNKYRKLWIFISSNGTSWNIASGTTGSTYLENGKTYWIKVSFDGSYYKVWLSEDGTEYKEEISISSTDKVYTTDQPICLGNHYGNACTADTQFDLQETYVRVDEELYWSAEIISGVWTKK